MRFGRSQQTRRPELTRFGFKGWSAVTAIVAVLLVRLFTIGETDDAELRRMVSLVLGGSSLPGSVTGLLGISGHTDPSIEIHSVRVSAPLLSLGAVSDTVIVRVEWSRRQEPRRVEYHRFDRGPLSGWQYRFPSSASLYYMNFL